MAFGMAAAQIVSERSKGEGRRHKTVQRALSMASTPSFSPKKTRGTHTSDWSPTKTAMYLHVFTLISMTLFPDASARAAQPPLPDASCAPWQHWR